jgi:hypothetical protein
MLDGADVLFATLGRQVRPVQEVGILSSLPPQTKTKPLAKRSSSTPGASPCPAVPPSQSRNANSSAGWLVARAAPISLSLAPMRSTCA